jgi:AraC-like DNA-binding protein
MIAGVSATVNAKTVRAALGAAKASGIDAGELARTWALTEALTDVDARFPHAAWLGLWRDILARTGNESIGIEAAERLPWGHWDVVDYLVGTSEDLRSALRRFERYFALVSTGVAHVLEPHGDAVHLVRRYSPDCQTRLLAPAEFAFAAVIAHTRIPLGVRWCPVEVRFAGPAPSNDATHRRFFGCPVRFDATTSAIVIGAPELALRMSRPDPELGRILERHADVLVGELGSESDLVARVRRIIVDGLPDGEVSVTRTARQLGLSVRTLQRRLADSGKTFDEVYDGTRKELARRYLGDPALSIQETAHLLAFVDLRGFYRAFRRWEGCTPAEYRRRASETAGGTGVSCP